MRVGLLAAFLALFCSTAQSQERLVVAGQQLNEIIFALGAGDKVVATHGYREHIPGVESAAQVLGFGPMVRSAESLLAFRPTAVWVMDERIDEATLAQLRAVGIPVEQFPKSWTLDQVPDFIGDIARRLSVESAAAAVVTAFSLELAQVRSLQPLVAAPPSIFILAGGNRPMLTAGRDSDFQRLIDLARGVNASTHQGYQLLSAEETMRIAPEVIFLLDEALPDGQPPVVIDLPGLRLTPAARAGRFVTIDGHCLTDFGIYTPSCVLKLRRDLEQAILR
jgi:iron complex transport system substrate-binding protein